jgi:hypothetical protein
MYMYFNTCLEIQIWIELSRKKYNSINSSQNKGLCSSCIALSFDWFWLKFMAHCLVSIDSFSCHLFCISSFFWPEHHWRDIISQNAHLVHHNWYHIRFASQQLNGCSKLMLLFQSQSENPALRIDYSLVLYRLTLLTSNA